MKENDRIVVAKPVPSRPTCSSFRSFSELLAGAINASPPNVCTETTVPAIRPKTVRFKPATNRNPIGGVVSSQADTPGTAGTSTGEASKSDSKPTVIYKPLAKLVSRSTVSLLANMGSFSPGIQQPPPSANTYVPHQSDDNRYNSRSQQGVSYNQSIPSRAETNQTSEPLKSASQAMEEDPKTTPPLVSGDRPSYDGYNWRKYGQKQVKGSEYPRSYYKCTHPNCPVKKKVERSLDGQIAEIVYKGEHNHPKPQPPKRSSSGTNQGLGLADGAVQDANTPLSIGQLQERNEGSEGRVENNQNEGGLSSQVGLGRKTALAFDPVTSRTVNPQGGTQDNSCGLSGECEGGGNAMELEDDEPKSKRRKNDVQSNEAGTPREGAQDGRVSVQNSTDVDVIGDGFRWRKYGQKVVKGNPYPRSYYRCTGPKCNVRKYVERASDDPRAFITTYEGKHNHEMPLRTTNSGASESDPQAGTGKNKQ